MKKTLATLALAGTLAACGAQGTHVADRPARHAHLVRPTIVVPPSPPRDHVQDVGDCLAAQAYIHANAAAGTTVECPTLHALPPGKASTVLGGVIYIANTDCVAAYKDEAWNSHGFDREGNFAPYQGVIDPFGPCYR